MNLHLESSTKSSCCVASHQDLYGTLDLQSPIRKLNTASPSTFLQEIKSSFSWTSLFKSPTSSTLCFGEPTLGKLNQVKLLCSISSRTIWDRTLAKSNQETELCITKHIPLCDSAGHTGIPFPTPRSSSETKRVSNSHSSSVTTPSSTMILGKPKIEVTKVLTHTNGKNGGHFYGENWHNTTKNGENSYCNSRLVSKNLMHHAGRNGEHSCVPFNLSNTSCGFMHKEVDWGGKHPINSVVDWQRHETYPTGHNISEMDLGALHDSSSFLFLVNIDYDAKPKDFFTRVMGRTIRKDNFHHSQKLEPCRREIGTSSRTSEGSKPPGSPVGPTEGPHIFTMSTT